MAFDWQEVKFILDLLVPFIVLIGAPIGLYQYYRAVKKEQMDREYGTYNALDDKFIEFQRICLEYPQLDIFDVKDAAPVQLNDEQKKQEIIAFTILISIFERAFLMYLDQSTTIKQKQWAEWDEYIREFCKRENFKSAWKISGMTFDKEFEDYIKQFIE